MAKYRNFQAFLTVDQFSTLTLLSTHPTKANNRYQKYFKMSKALLLDYTQWVLNVNQTINDGKVHTSFKQNIQVWFLLLFDNVYQPM